MINEQINEEFFRLYLRDEVVNAADFNTLIHHDVQFLDPDYHQFIYGILWSAKVNKKRAYFYVVLKIGNELADVFLKSIIKEIVTEKIIAWHKEKFPHESKEPMVECIEFLCDRHSQL
jgi:hypothetical protein